MSFRLAMARTCCLLSATQLLPLAYAPLSAQAPSAQSVARQGVGIIRGTVSSDLGGTLEGAQLRLLFGSVPTARTETDENGEFTFPGLQPGPAWLEVRRLGFRPESVSVLVSDTTPLTLSVRMVRAAIELGAVKVIGRRDVTGPMAGFYHRQQTGSGRFFTYQEIRRRNAASMSDLLRGVPGVRIDQRGPLTSVRIRGGRCAPLVWLDGQAMMAGEVDLDAWDPNTFGGVEIYSGPASVPIEFQRNQRMSSACGTIVLWSRQREPSEPKRKKGVLSPAARIAALIEQGNTFLPGEVDRSALPDSSFLVKPIYPDSLFDAAVGGRVIAEIVITESGASVMETFSALSFTHRSFVEPVRRALRDQRFIPAVRRGSMVQQVLQLPFDFIPDSTARRRR